MMPSSSRNGNEPFLRQFLRSSAKMAIARRWFLNRQREGGVCAKRTTLEQVVRSLSETGAPAAPTGQGSVVASP